MRACLCVRENPPGSLPVLASGRECCVPGEVAVENVCEEEDNSRVGVTRKTTDTTKGDGARL